MCMSKMIKVKNPIFHLCSEGMRIPEGSICFNFDNLQDFIDWTTDFDKCPYVYIFHMCKDDIHSYSVTSSSGDVGVYHTSDELVSVFDTVERDQWTKDNEVKSK